MPAAAMVVQVLAGLLLSRMPPINRLVVFRRAGVPARSNVSRGVLRTPVRVDGCNWLSSAARGEPRAVAVAATPL